MVIHMGNSVVCQDIMIGWSHQPCIANFDGIAKILGELTEKAIQLARKFFYGHAVPLEFEEEGTRMWLKAGVTVGLQHQIFEELRI